jgi:tRNA 2-selenouridine synthase
MMSTWNDTDLRTLFLSNTPLIDVRSPIEFQDGSIPNSINLPIMNNEERKLIGTCYKENGQEAAIKLGHDLINGTIKEERINLWHNYLKNNSTAQLFCFRGGLRSQISCQWVNEKGYDKHPLPGGYKRLRKFFLSWLDEAPMPSFVRLGGYTGSGKTKLLNKVTHHIDLEGLANHRGSAFGPKGEQPSQITFENSIALELMRLNQYKIVLEDESVTLGKLTIPGRIFKSMRESPLVILEVTQEERLINIFNDYVKSSSADFFKSCFLKIQKRLGASKVKELTDEVDLAFAKPMELKNHEKWILTLLHEYYDPLYQKDLRNNRNKVIFQGNEHEVLAYLRQS